MAENICVSCLQQITEEIPPTRPDFCTECWWQLSPSRKRAHLIQVRQARALEKIADILSKVKDGDDDEPWKNSLWRP